MTNRRQLLTTFTAGLLLASGSVRSAAREAAGPSCGRTRATTTGPFYVGNSPEAMNINLLGVAGAPMRVSGTVLGGADGQTPLAGARLELWHCDGDGHYHPEDNGDIARYRAEEINLRGQVATGADGHFAFDSIVPGHYGNRRRHLHWRLVADGHRPLVTQTYWLDERGTRHERGDPVDRNPEVCRWVAFRPEGESMKGDVVFVLERLA